MLYYQPSCSFNEMDPVSAKCLRDYAKEKNMKIRACCHFDKNILTDDDIGIYFCQACREVMEKQGFRTKSFWEILDEDESFVLPDYSGMKFVIQDCWRDREHPEIHKAIRSLLAKMHIEYVELPKNYYRDDNPDNSPVVTWRAHANLLYSNWINYYVYQETPYNINDIK